MSCTIQNHEQSRLFLITRKAFCKVGSVQASSNAAYSDQVLPGADCFRLESFAGVGRKSNLQILEGGKARLKLASCIDRHRHRSLHTRCAKCFGQLGCKVFVSLPLRQKDPFPLMSAASNVSF